MDWGLNPCRSVKSVVSTAVSGISPLPLRPPVKPDSGVGLGSPSAFIRACQPEPWRRLVISGKVIPSVPPVKSDVGLFGCCAPLGPLCQKTLSRNWILQEAAEETERQDGRGQTAESGGDSTEHTEGRIFNREWRE